MGDNKDSNLVTETDALKLEEKDDDFVDPWNVESKSDAGIDYDKLIRKHLSIRTIDRSFGVHTRINNNNIMKLSDVQKQLVDMHKLGVGN